MVIGTQTMVADTRMMVADAQMKAADTQTMVADIHRKVLTGQESTSDKNHSVRAISIYQHWNAYHRLDPIKVSDTEYCGALQSYVFIESRLVNYLPRPRGAVSDVTS